MIADEAHRHHGHGTTDQIHQILAGALAAGGVGGGEAAAGAAPGRGPAAAAGVGAGGSSGHSKLRPQQRRQPRGVTYVGFTATPSPKVLLIALLAMITTGVARITQGGTTCEASRTSGPGDLQPKANWTATGPVVRRRFELHCYPRHLHLNSDPRIGAGAVWCGHRGARRSHCA